MSRFSGLPDPLPRGHTNRSTRFDNIRERLVAAVKASPHSHANMEARYAGIDNNAAAAIASVKTAPDARTTPSAIAGRKPTRRTEAAPTAAAEDTAWPVPAEIAAQGVVKAEGYRITFTAVTDQLRRMSMIPAARGRAGSLIRMVAAGASDNEIRSNLELKPTDSQIATSAIWDRAIVAVCGSIVKDGSGSELPAPRDAARQRMLAVAAHPYFAGNEAKALTHLTSRALMTVGAQGIVKLVAMTNGERRSVEAWGGDIHPAWAKAIESTFR